MRWASLSQTENINAGWGDLSLNQLSHFEMTNAFRLMLGVHLWVIIHQELWRMKTVILPLVSYNKWKPCSLNPSIRSCFLLWKLPPFPLKIILPRHTVYVVFIHVDEEETTGEYSFDVFLASTCICTGYDHGHGYVHVAPFRRQPQVSAVCSLDRSNECVLLNDWLNDHL